MKPITMAALGLASLLLAACNPAAPKPDAAIPQAPIDKTIAAVSQELAAYCATAQVGIVLLRTINTSSRPQVRQSIAAAEAARAAFCAAPPRDLNTAIAAMAAIATDVITVWRASQ